MNGVTSTRKVEAHIPNVVAIISDPDDVYYLLLIESLFDVIVSLSSVEVVNL